MWLNLNSITVSQLNTFNSNIKEKQKYSVKVGKTKNYYHKATIRSQLRKLSIELASALKLHGEMGAYSQEEQIFVHNCIFLFKGNSIMYFFFKYL